MKKFLSAILCIVALPAYGNSMTLVDALRATYGACVGIDEELADLKKMAGINTAITSVGTVAGAGATVVGMVKTSTDKKAEELEKILEEIKKLSENQTPMTEAEISIFMSEFNDAYDVAIASSDEVESELDKTTEKSKKLGNWRTGLVAGAAATNVAGAIIASTNKVDEDLNTQIKNCLVAVENLRNAMMQARMNGEDVSEAQLIADTCGEYEFADLSKINTRAKGAAISSGVGATTGLIGTITSASANGSSVRDDNSAAGRQREKNLNMASNVLAGTTTAASVTATVFNATQIKAIKQVAEIAQKCTGVLK